MKNTKFYALLGCCLLAASAAAESGTELVQQARRETDPAKQVRLLTQAIHKAPGLATAWHYRADAYRAQGKTQQALADYTRALELTPQNAFRYYARALAYIDAHKYTQAEADLSKALSLKKDKPDFYLARAQVYKQLGKYTDEAADYKQYLAHRAKTPEIALDLAEAYIRTYQYTQAEQELDFVQQQQPEAAEPYFWRGRIQHNRGNLDEAVSFYSKAIHRDGALAAAYRYRAAAYKDMGELEASAEDYTRLVELTPEAIFYNRRGLVYEEMKEWDKALDDYNKTIELLPKWPIGYNNRGYVYLKQKKYTQAREDFETALRLDDTLPTPYVNLAGLYWLQKKDRRNVYRHLEKALKRNFRDFESLYDEDRKGWMFNGINSTSEFRAVMYQ